MLSEEQRVTLRAVVDCVVPPDTWPGGVEAGVVAFLERMLATDLAHEGENYRRFLDALGTDFATLPPDAQTAQLQQIEQSTEGRGFFRRLVEQVQEGFYTSPTGIQMIGWTIKG